MKKILYCFVAVIVMALGVRAQQAGGGPAKTQISDVVYRADGTPASGTLVISWPAFVTADSKSVAAGTVSVPISEGGSVNLGLAPNAGATPEGTSYKVVLKLDDGSSNVEYWTVPTTSPTTIGALRSTVVPSAVAMQVVSKSYVDAQLAAVVSGNNVVHLDGTEMITGDKTFAGKVTLGGDPADMLEAATKQYVDNHAANLSAPGPIGTTTPNTIKVTSLSASGNLDTTAGSIHAYNGTIAGNTGSFTNLFAQSVFKIANYGGLNGTIDASALTFNRTFTLPDISGSFALTSDLPNLATPGPIGETTPDIISGTIITGTSGNFSGDVTVSNLAAGTINLKYHVPLSASDAAASANALFAACVSAGIGCDVTLSGQVRTTATTITVPTDTGKAYRLLCESGGGLNYTGTGWATVIGGIGATGNYNGSSIENCSITGTSSGLGGLHITGLIFDFLSRNNRISGFTNGYGTLVEGAVAGKIEGGADSGNKWNTVLAGITTPYNSGANAVTVREHAMGGASAWGLWVRDAAGAITQGVSIENPVFEGNGTAGDFATGNVFIQSCQSCKLAGGYYEQGGLSGVQQIQVGDAGTTPTDILIDHPFISTQWSNLASNNPSSIYLKSGTGLTVANFRDPSAGIGSNGTFHPITIGAAAREVSIEVAAPGVTDDNQIAYETGAVQPKALKTRMTGVTSMPTPISYYGNTIAAQKLYTFPSGTFVPLTQDSYTAGQPFSVLLFSTQLDGTAAAYTPLQLVSSSSPTITVGASTLTFSVQNGGGPIGATASGSTINLAGFIWVVPNAAVAPSSNIMGVNGNLRVNGTITGYTPVGGYEAFRMYSGGGTGPKYWSLGSDAVYSDSDLFFCFNGATGGSCAGYFDGSGVFHANQGVVGNLTGNASTAGNLSGTPALPNGTTATTQAAADNSTKLATTAYVDTLGATKISSSSLSNVTNDVQTKAAIMPNTAPSAGQVPCGNAGNTAYTPCTISGDMAITSGGAATVNKNNGVPITVVTALGNTGTLTMDFSKGRIFTTTPSGAITLNATNCTTGAMATVIVTTSGTTSYTITPNTNFKGTALTTGTTSGKTFGWSFICNGTTAYQTSTATAAM